MASDLVQTLLAGYAIIGTVVAGALWSALGRAQRRLDALHETRVNDLRELLAALHRNTEALNDTLKVVKEVIKWQS